MAGSSLLALIDDIAGILDDVALMTKVAGKKTAGVLGDDLALNAQQVAGVRAERELPVVWAVAQGSFRNKLILVPLALALSAFAPWAVMPLLMLGGAFLCYEGCEKLLHKYLPSDGHEPETPSAVPAETAEAPTPSIAPEDVEKEKIKGAIRTDFILSAEIIIITLGTVADAVFAKQVAVLAAIAVIMTIGVYGLVAGIVKLDDFGFYLTRQGNGNDSGRRRRAVGRAILLAAPWLMKSLSVIGTAAMFMVGGGILTHGIPYVHGLIESVAVPVASIPGVGGILKIVVPTLLDVFIGLLVGTAVLALTTLAGRIVRPARSG